MNVITEIIKVVIYPPTGEVVYRKGEDHCTDIFTDDVSRTLTLIRKNEKYIFVNMPFVLIYK